MLRLVLPEILIVLFLAIELVGPWYHQTSYFPVLRTLGRLALYPFRKAGLLRSATGRLSQAQQRLEAAKVDLKAAELETRAEALEEEANNMREGRN